MNETLQKRLKKITDAQALLDEDSAGYQLLEKLKQKFLKDEEIRRTRGVMLRHKR